MLHRTQAVRCPAESPTTGQTTAAVQPTPVSRVLTRFTSGGSQDEFTDMHERQAKAKRTVAEKEAGRLAGEAEALLPAPVPPPLSALPAPVFTPQQPSRAFTPQPSSSASLLAGGGSAYAAASPFTPSASSRSASRCGPDQRV